MNHPSDPKLEAEGVDNTRRRLTKAGLAAPAVLGVLASRPVLGQSLHNCTPSGHVSGFASANPNGTPCPTLGNPPSFFRAGTTNWPAGLYFINNNGGVRLFKNAPNGLGVLFADAYQRRRTSDNNITDANVWDVLAGCVINPTNGNCRPGFVLEARSGFYPDLTLGQEAVAACMNALLYHPARFPISPQQVVGMFNNVVRFGGLDEVASNAFWNAAEVTEYFRSLHGA